MRAHINVPAATTFTSAPLRNRLRVELNQPLDAVWSLIGDVSRLPEYSAGLERVESTTDARARCTEYTCHFKARVAGEESIADRSVVRWYERNVGYASSAQACNASVSPTIYVSSASNPQEGGPS